MSVMPMGLILLIFFAFTLVVAVMFIGWVMTAMVKGLGYGVRTLVNGPQASAGTRPCTQFRCKQLNPVDAIFCRRCGQSLNKTSKPMSSRSVQPAANLPGKVVGNFLSEEDRVSDSLRKS